MPCVDTHYFKRRIPVMPLKWGGDFEIQKRFQLLRKEPQMLVLGWEWTVVRFVKWHIPKLSDNVEDIWRRYKTMEKNAWCINTAHLDFKPSLTIHTSASLVSEEVVERNLGGDLHSCLESILYCCQSEVQFLYTQDLFPSWSVFWFLVAILVSMNFIFNSILCFLSQASNGYFLPSREPLLPHHWGWHKTAFQALSFSPSHN